MPTITILCLNPQCGGLCKQTKRKQYVLLSPNCECFSRNEVQQEHNIQKYHLAISAHQLY